MKITAVRPIFAQGERRTFVFIKVETDQQGLVGWGEASVEGKPRAVAGCVQDMEPMILGFDPLEVELCWQVLYRSGFWRQGIIGLSALSGIDQALWDIKGKEAGKPIYELLGGKVRDRVRMYTHFGGDTPDAMAESAMSKAAKGWDAVKTVPVPITNILDGPRVLDEAEAGLRAVREAVGNDVDILLDMHGRVTPQMAIRYAQRFEVYEPFFMEEPVQAENAAAMAQVASATSIPIATGERLFTRGAFARFSRLERPACCSRTLATQGASARSAALRRWGRSITQAWPPTILTAPYRPRPVSMWISRRPTS